MKNIIHTVVIVFFLVIMPLDASHLAGAPTLVEAQTPYIKEDKKDLDEKVKHPKDYTLTESINKFSLEYNIPREWLINLASCESTYGKRLIGDGGNAYGQFQYWEDTWKEFERRSGMNLDKYSSYDQVKMTAWALKNNLGHRWSCDYQTGNVVKF